MDLGALRPVKLLDRLQQFGEQQVMERKGWRGPLIQGSYVVGDTIELRLTVEHQMNLMGCTLVFSHNVDESIDLTLEDVPEPDETASSRRSKALCTLAKRSG